MEAGLGCVWGYFELDISSIKGRCVWGVWIREVKGWGLYIEFIVFCFFFVRMS